MNYKLTAVILTLFLLSCSSTRLPDEIIDKELFTVILGDFTYKGAFRQIPHIGSGFRDSLRTRLDQHPYFDVLDRDAADFLMKELKLSELGLLREQGKLRKGMGRNARYLIRGVVTDFDTEVEASVWRETHAKSILEYGSTTALDSLLNFSFDVKVDVMSFELTIYDLETQEVFYTGSFTGESYSTKVNYSEITFGTSKFWGEPLGEATNEALDKAVKYITEDLPKRKWYPSVLGYHGKTTFSEGEQVIISGGEKRGAEAGSIWQLVIVPERLTDREGRFAGYSPERLQDAFIRIDDIQPNQARGVVLKGSVKQHDALTIVPDKNSG